MHFSRPSGQRLSWWRPWNRGAVGCFSNGYCSVTTFLNMVRKVTPNPATGSQNCSLRVLESAIESLLVRHSVVLGGRDRRADGRAVRPGPAEDQRRCGPAHRATRRHGGDGVAACGDRLLAGLVRRRIARAATGRRPGGLVLVVTDEEEQ